MILQTTKIVLDCTPKHASDSGLKITAKCYTKGNSADNLSGLTLLFTHCIGAHKEQWEPTIEHIFKSQETKDECHRIREAWSFDWQNHGDAAILNREALQTRLDGVSIYEWAPPIAAFVRSPRMNGHRMVALGHSAGAGAIMLTTKEFALSQIPYAAIVLIEPAMVTRELFNAHIEDRMASMNFAVSATSVRRDTWVSREVAFTWFSKRFPWNVWDPRVVRILTEHGLHESSSGVTLKCDKRQEAVSYPDVEGHFESTTILGRICYALPIHLVWGTRSDLIPEFIQDSLSDSAEGRFVASVTRVKGAGHMVVQEQPDRLAMSLCEILDSVPIRHAARSRL
ncbi:hypothetical protein Hypma_011238 [Hypsizygus marmoreus]|uniref:AB hydrolase-1 domain-containing protein n=1 Tax=Hypsizygus marmoreus TaxID=39966 RepID=A0A369JMR7_HYPMA|nr:hypothetical protein Hypma_011238 [Hypsizygus marmoreus]